MMSAITCPSCHTVAPPGAIFCDQCGYDLRTVAPATPAPIPPTYLVSETGTGEITCPNCQHRNIAGSAFCENCGTKLIKPSAIPPAPQTPMQPAPLETAVSVPPVVPPAPAPTSISGRLVIQGKNISIPIPPGKQTIVIGREDPVSGVFPDIDLDPHGGHEAGVGRRHAQLILQGGQVHLEDLDSVNGTVLNKQKLLPRSPMPIHHRDEIRLGKMVIVYLEK